MMKRLSVLLQAVHSWGWSVWHKHRLTLSTLTRSPLRLLAAAQCFSESGSRCFLYNLINHLNINSDNKLVLQVTWAQSLVLNTLKLCKQKQNSEIQISWHKLCAWNAHRLQAFNVQWLINEEGGGGSDEFEGIHNLLYRRIIEIMAFNVLFLFPIFT